MRVVRGGKSKRQQRQAKVKCTKRQMKRKRNWGHCVAYGGGGRWQRVDGIASTEPESRDKSIDA